MQNPAPGLFLHSVLNAGNVCKDGAEISNLSRKPTVSCVLTSRIYVSAAISTVAHVDLLAMPSPTDLAKRDLVKYVLVDPGLCAPLLLGMLSSC